MPALSPTQTKCWDIARVLSPAHWATAWICTHSCWPTNHFSQPGSDWTVFFSRSFVAYLWKFFDHDGNILISIDQSLGKQYCKLSQCLMPRNWVILHNILTIPLTESTLTNVFISLLFWMWALGFARGVYIVYFFAFSLSLVESPFYFLFIHVTFWRADSVNPILDPRE